MADIDLTEELEIQFDAGAVAQVLATNQEFLNQIRNGLAWDSRRRGNTLGHWANRRRRDPTQQPNTKQRVF